VREAALVPLPSVGVPAPQSDQHRFVELALCSALTLSLCFGSAQPLDLGKTLALGFCRALALSLELCGALTLDFGEALAFGLRGTPTLFLGGSLPFCVRAPSYFEIVGDQLSATWATGRGRPSR
jgi:hypothetical protein